jgi:hypothetical protein
MVLVRMLLVLGGGINGLATEDRWVYRRIRIQVLDYASLCWLVYLDIILEFMSSLFQCFVI